MLVVPGLAAAVAGPASILDWLALLLLSALFAWVFSALGRRVRGAGGVIAYATAGLGSTVGSVVGWCFLAGVVVGAPVVCLIGGGYVAEAFGAGTGASIGIAAGLLVVVLMGTLASTTSSTSLQLVVVGVLITLVVVAVAGSLHNLRFENWTPFTPHGVASIGSAAPVLMFSFIGWEVMASLVGELRDTDRQLPRVVTIAFIVTAVLYLGLAVATIGVLGPAAGGATPLSALMKIILGPTAGGVVAAVAAVVLTVAACNAYLTSAREMVATMRQGTARWVLPVGVAVVAAAVLGAIGAYWLTLTPLVAVPTTLFLAVYVGCMVSATRILTGPVRLAAAFATAATSAILALCGSALLAVAAVATVVVIARRRAAANLRPSSTPDHGRQDTTTLAL